MCLLCIEIAKGKMTVGEARQALKELVATSSGSEKTHYEHLQSIPDKDLNDEAKKYQPPTR